MKIVLILIIGVLFYRLLYWKNEAAWFKNQSKDRQYQVQRLQFSLENYKANPGSLCFFGDSIVLLWPTKEYFPFSYNRGISSETTLKLLFRFKKDVLSLHPREVIIVGGSNDVTLGIEPIKTAHNLNDMVAMATKQNIKVLLCTLPPIDGKRQTNLNNWIRNFGYPYIDFDLLMADHPEYFFDRIHPNLRGYEAMSKLVLEKIHE